MFVEVAGCVVDAVGRGVVTTELVMGPGGVVDEDDLGVVDVDLVVVAFYCSVIVLLNKGMFGHTSTLWK